MRHVIVITTSRKENCMKEVGGDKGDSGEGGKESEKLFHGRSKVATLSPDKASYLSVG